MNKLVDFVHELCLYILNLFRLDFITRAFSTFCACVCTLCAYVHVHCVQLCTLYTHVYVHVCTLCACVYTVYIWRPAVNIRYLPLSSSTLCFSGITDPDAHRFTLTRGLASRGLFTVSTPQPEDHGCTSLCQAVLAGTGHPN